MDNSTLNANAPWLRGFRNLSREHGFEALQIEGKIPERLKGTFFRNGPGILKPFDRPYVHWFDGDGAIAAVRLHPGHAEGAVRLVQNPELEREKRAGKMLYDGYNEKNSSVLQRLKILIGGSTIKNTSNTSVMMWQGKLLSLMEAKLPVQIDSSDLSTLGETTLDGTLTHALSAHPHRVPSRNATYSFAIEYGPRCKLQVFEFPDSGPVRLLTKVGLSWGGMIHDFIATQNHLIFFSPPLKLNLMKFIFGKGGYSSCLKWQPDLGTEVIIIPLSNPKEFVRFTTDPLFVFHFSNAFERGGDLIVDYIHSPDFEINQWLEEVIKGPAQASFKSSFYRAIINLKDKKVKFENISSAACEFPSVGPGDLCQDYRNVFLNTFSNDAAKKGITDRFGKLDLKTGQMTTVPLPAGQYPGEPFFVEDHLMSLVYDSVSDRSYLGIADAQQLEKGIIAKAWFDHAIPPGFHGIFVGD